VRNRFVLPTCRETLLSNGKAKGVINRFSFTYHRGYMLAYRKKRSVINAPGEKHSEHERAFVNFISLYE
jgi:hypothetical protein